MRIIRVFPRRTSYTPTDALAFVGDPPLWVPEADEVWVSCTFTWDKAEAERLAEAWQPYAPVVRLGGPAYDAEAGEFVPGRYVKRGVTFTSRGCPNHCSFCLVPPREGRLTLLDPIPEGWIVNDNNLLACPKEHRQRVYQMLARQPKPATFSGGLQASLITDEIADELRGLRIEQVFLAADSEAALGPLGQAVRRLSFLPRRKLRCYILLAYRGEMIEQAEARLERAWNIGVMPFAMLYQPPDRHIDYSRAWRKLAKKWIRPPAMKAAHRDASQ